MIGIKTGTKIIEDFIEETKLKNGVYYAQKAWIEDIDIQISALTALYKLDCVQFDSPKVNNGNDEDDYDLKSV